MALLYLSRTHIPQPQSPSLDGQTIPAQSEMFRCASLEHLVICNVTHPSPNPITFFKYSVHVSTYVDSSSMISISPNPHAASNGRLIAMPRLSHIDLRLHIDSASLIFNRLQLPTFTTFSTIIMPNGFLSPASWDVFLTPTFEQVLSESTVPSASLQYSDGWVLKAGSGSFVLGTQSQSTAYLRGLLSMLVDVPVAVIYKKAPSTYIVTELASIHNVLQNITHLRLPRNCTDFYDVLNAMISGSRGRILQTLQTLELKQARFGSGGISNFDVIDSLVGLIEAVARLSPRNTLVIRNRCDQSEVEEAQRAMNERFPSSDVFKDEGLKVEWWDKLEEPLDPDSEEPSNV